MDVRVPFSLVLGAFGTSAVVSGSGFGPVTTQVAWAPPSPDQAPDGMDFRASSPRLVLAIPRATVPAPRVGFTVVVAEQDGDAARSFRIDEIEREEPDHVRCVMVRG